MTRKFYYPPSVEQLGFKRPEDLARAVLMHVIRRRVRRLVADVYWPRIPDGADEPIGLFADCTGRKE